MNKHRNGYGLFQLINRKTFNQLVDKWEIDKGVKSFSTWEMTCALLSTMVMRLGSYRDMELTFGVPRTTIGDALSKRSFGFFQDLCDHVLLDIRARTENRKVKKAIRRLLAIDSTECRVHGSMFTLHGWQQRAAYGFHIASAKLHVIYDV